MLFKTKLFKLFNATFTWNEIVKIADWAGCTCDNATLQLRTVKYRNSKKFRMYDVTRRDATRNFKWHVEFNQRVARVRRANPAESSSANNPRIKLCKKIRHAHAETFVTTKLRLIVHENLVRRLIAREISFSKWIQKRFRSFCEKLLKPYTFYGLIALIRFELEEN